MRTIIFANGQMAESPNIRKSVREDDFIIAADGGTANCLSLGFRPHVIVGDLDSVNREDLNRLTASGTRIQRHPPQKDETDLEIALLLAATKGSDEIIVLGALGKRWDMTFANLLLPLRPDLENVKIRFIDGPQELFLIQGEEKVKIRGKAGDTVSLIPVSGDATGVTLSGLAYPLRNETLAFGCARGVSNRLKGETATVRLEKGTLLCVVIRENRKISS